MRFHRLLSRTCRLVLVTLLLTACSGGIGSGLLSGGAASMLFGGGGSTPVMGYVPGQTPVLLQNVYFYVDYGANNDTPIVVHLVIVYDPLLITTFTNMTPQAYFASADQIYNDHMQTMDVIKWNGFPAGSQKGPFPVQYTKSNPVAAFLFARYINSNNTKARLGSDKDISVIMQSNSFYVIPYSGDE